MKTRIKLLTAIIALSFAFVFFAACGGDPGIIVEYRNVYEDDFYSGEDPDYYEYDGTDRMVINDHSVAVMENIPVRVMFSQNIADAMDEGEYTLDFEVVSTVRDGGAAYPANNAIVIWNNRIYGIKSFRTATVEATLVVDMYCEDEGEEVPVTFTEEFEVAVTGSMYRERRDLEEWFDPIDIQPVAQLTEDRAFSLGTDASQIQAVLDFGGRYFGADGTEQSPWVIMAEHGVNTVRLRKWVDPWHHYTENGSPRTMPYGGGMNDLNNTARMALDAYMVGLNIHLAFHYSDFWAHPGQQVIPKLWYDMIRAGEITNRGQLATVLREYTRDTLQYLYDMGITVAEVGIGNEINSGMLLQFPNMENINSARPINAGRTYSASRVTSIPVTGGGTATIANLGGSGAGNRNQFLIAGTRGTFDVFPNADIIIHWAGGNGGVWNDFATSARNAFITAGFDGTGGERHFDDFAVVGVSWYQQYHGNPVQLTNHVNTFDVGAAGSRVRLMVVETSYAFTLERHPYASNMFTAGYMNPNYPLTVQGQGNNLRSIIQATAQASHGAGVITWEGAWIPVRGAGTAGTNTSNSWANQALFSYDGMALPSLATFARVWA